MDEGGRRIGLHPLDRPDRVFELERCHITRAELMPLWAGVAARSARCCRPRSGSSCSGSIAAGGRHVLLVVEAGADAWQGGGSARVGARRPGPSTPRLDPAGGRGAAPARVARSAGSRIPATVFEQVHPAMGDKVRAFAIGALGDVAGRQVWDLYAGIGETTAALARAGATVESVESDARAVAEAEARGPAADAAAWGGWSACSTGCVAPDLVITNPPRTGMDERVTAALERFGARADRLHLLRSRHAGARPRAGCRATG